jgi:cell division protein FtsL
VGLRWPGQGGGRGAPPGFPGTSRRPSPEPDPDPEPEREPEPAESPEPGLGPLRAPRSPLRTGIEPARVVKSPVVRMSGLVSSRWPGLNSGETPVVLPLSYGRSRTKSHVTVHRDLDGDGGDIEATVTPLPSLHERRSAAAAEVEASDPSAESPDTGDTPALVGGPGVVRRVAGPFQTVVAAVYAALADPLVNAPPEVREKRAIQVRRVGIAAAGTLLACILVYAIFPVQTYLDLRSATQRAEEQREALQRANDELERRQQELNEDETVEEIAREDYGMVLPGEESYGVLPPPEATTTTAPSTTTTAPGGFPSP